MLCLIDNYDSFTYNIVHYLHELGVNVKVILNDSMTAQSVLNLNPSHILLSPGPGAPYESGISKELLLLAASNKIPVLGICLGHEIISETFGGTVIHANKIMHGKTSLIKHKDQNIYSNIPQSFKAARYHSLIVDKKKFPNCLEVTAWTETQGTEENEIMGLKHRTLPIHGIQFHPESILTEHGHKMLSNFLNLQLLSSNDPITVKSDTPILEN